MVKLHYGCLAPKHDPRRLMLGEYLLSPLPAPPPASDRTAQIPVDGWGAMLNLDEGDCTIAGQGHSILGLSATARGTPIVVPDADIQAAYVALTGYDPATGANDNGCLITDVMEYRRTVGIGGYKISAWAAFPCASITAIQQAVDLFGGAMIGMSVPQSAEDQFNAGQPWSVPWFSSIIGRHCVWIAAYDANYLYPITWGTAQPMEYPFCQKYVDESYVVIDPFWFASGTSLDPTGLNLAQLTSDQAALAQAA